MRSAFAPLRGNAETMEIQRFAEKCLIIDNLTQKEKGVRNLKRCLEIIYTKLNLFRLMKPESKLFDKKTLSLNVTFPFTVEKEMIDKLIKKYDKRDVPEGMYL